MNWFKKILGGTSKEDLIKSLEETYSNLKSNNPDKDEHWFLANAWLARYGNWKVAKQRGVKLTKYNAYTDTFQYSVLDPPKSIRGLALFLVYKELGEKEAEAEAEEFSQIMESIEKIRERGSLMDKYKQRNPFTWNEIQQENDKSFHGLSGYLDATEHLEQNPEERERITKKLEDIDAGRTPDTNPNAVKLNLSKEQIGEIERLMEEDK